MKKTFGTIIAVMLIISSFSVFADGGTIQFDQKKSTVSVKYNSSSYEDLKVIVQKGEEKYYYNLYDNNEVFPLQMGSGNYTVGVYKKVSPGSNRYRTVLKSTQNLSLKDNEVFLQSVQNIDWSDKSKATKLAKELALKNATDKESFKAIYDSIVSSIVYDHHKAETVSSRYIPVIDETLAEKKGICYDYSSLMAGMLRSIDIPTKMIHGNSTQVAAYHAWNEVLLDGKWVIIDSTVDAQLLSWGSKYETEKSKKDYTTVKQF